MEWLTNRRQPWSLFVLAPEPSVRNLGSTSARLDDVSNLGIGEDVSQERSTVHGSTLH